MCHATFYNKSCRLPSWFPCIILSEQIKITELVHIYTMEKRGLAIKHNNDMDLGAQMNTDVWWWRGDAL